MFPEFYKWKYFKMEHLSGMLEMEFKIPILEQNCLVI